MNMTTDSSTPNASASAAAPADAAQSSKLKNLAESLKLEHQFLRAPFEYYKKMIMKNHQIAEKGILTAVSSVSAAADRCDEMSSEEAVAHLTSEVSSLQGLKRKLEEASKDETLQLQRCRARLDHLEAANIENLPEWKNTRLNRILVDYMLRNSYYGTAAKLAESSNVQELVDINVFIEAKRILDSIKNKDLAPVLAWCVKHRTRLEKTKSRLEFELRLLVFVELARKNEKIMAMKYARKFLAPIWGVTYALDMQIAMTALVFGSNTECEPYKALEEMAVKYGGKITCPRTGDVFDYTELSNSIPSTWRNN